MSKFRDLICVYLVVYSPTGKVPDLYLSHNQLSGSVPKSLGDLNFTVIDFSRNKLEGDISFLFGKNKTIQIVDFSRNLFEFNLTKVQFPASLTSLDLNHNSIAGSLPAGLTGLDLQFLNVSYNRLCGQIPNGGKLQSFDSTAYFHNRCLCGAPLPACKWFRLLRSCRKRVRLFIPCKYFTNTPR